jgi:hypothetical protein
MIHIETRGQEVSWNVDDNETTTYCCDHLDTFTISMIACTDDPDGTLADYGGCPEIVLMGCETDLHSVNEALPVGTLVKLVCPRACGTCGTAPAKEISAHGCPADYAVDSYFMDISTTGTVVTDWVQTGDWAASDEGWYEVTLPFAFPWYGQTESTVHIGTNGYLTFGSAHSESGESEPFPGSPDGPVDGVIGVFWADLNPGAHEDGAVYFQLDTFFAVFQWNAVRFYTDNNDPASNTFEAILYADGGVRLCYGDMDPNSDLSWTEESIGYESQGGTHGVQISYDVVPPSGTTYYIPPECTTMLLADYIGCFADSQNRALSGSSAFMLNQNDGKLTHTLGPIW